ncbi:alpha/beta hydrolase [Glycomyces sambucus]|uniref:alpha/beta hydrolase n=1 Tax=Glycomyces sambucus TaxID=380244 RepID=UPI000B8033DE|nr:alpha/beta hydrolase [Glycomyces sambucus]
MGEHAGVNYAEIPGFRPLALDLHVPHGKGPFPLVVWIHGGAFLFGDRRFLPETLRPGSVFQALVDAGIAVATIDYRFSSEALFPAQLDDVQAALAFLRESSARFDLDTDRIGLWGESAGGHLAALAGLTDGAIAAVAAWYPLTDLRVLDPHNPDTPWAKLIGGSPADLPAPAAQASPVSHVSATAPPFLIVHGTNDEALPLSQSEQLHALLVDSGANSTLLPVEGAGHTFTGHDDVEGIIALTVAFLAKHLTVPHP